MSKISVNKGSVTECRAAREILEEKRKTYELDLMTCVPQEKLSRDQIKADLSRLKQDPKMKKEYQILSERFEKANDSNSTLFIFFYDRNNKTVDSPFANIILNRIISYDQTKCNTSNLFKKEIAGIKHNILQLTLIINSSMYNGTCNKSIQKQLKNDITDEEMFLKSRQSVSVTTGHQTDDNDW